MPPLNLSDIVFSEQANHNFSRILGDLKKANLSINNRLSSILQDAAFVTEVAGILGLPLVANERCGSWYVEPDRKAASAYFKSTDGHAGQWQFSTRRLNLHLLQLIQKHDGFRIPDALSKTVPIWCCVMNHVLFPEETSWHEVYVPPAAVSDSERSQIQARIAAFVESFKQIGIDGEALRQCLHKPLRPLWVTQDGAALQPLGEVFLSCHPVVCCTSSRRVVGTEMSEGGYIQGAGDDTEAWAHGLTAPIFWKNRELLLATPESDLPDLIASLVTTDVPSNSGAAGLKQATSLITVGTLPIDLEVLDECACLISLLPKSTPSDAWIKSKRHMEVGLGKSKTGSRMLRDALDPICQHVSSFLENFTSLTQRPRVVVACESGKDLSVGLVLALDCWLVGDDGNMRPSNAERKFDKTTIRVRLGRLMQALPESNPSRNTLQSVNSFLMDWRK
ncbi:initiator tRNA phosphoribosyl transferase [Thozetella sp. PMI_491]|nr:initiator tRNA phosphoribosyl transferase [Thozetella sp. PMI_491]